MNEMFKQCQCGTHALGVEVTEDVCGDASQLQFVFSFWTFRSEYGGFSFIERLKMIWKLILGEDPMASYAILSEQDTSDLVDFIDLKLSQFNNKNTSL